MDIQNKDLGKAIITVAENNVYDSQKTYERLTLVKHNGHVYLSKQDVPVMFPMLLVQKMMNRILITVKKLLTKYLEV